MFKTAGKLSSKSRSSRPEVFLRKGVLKICSKFTREHPCRSAISIKLQSNFIEITLRHGCSPVNLMHVFRINFLKNTSGQLLLHIEVNDTRFQKSNIANKCQLLLLTLSWNLVFRKLFLEKYHVYLYPKF